MKICKLILWYELLLFWRNRSKIVALCLYFALSLFVIYSSKSAISEQQSNIQIFQQKVAQDYKQSVDAFQDSSSQTRKEQSAHAGYPSLVDYRMPRPAIYFPGPSASLSLGVRKWTPYTAEVQRYQTYKDQSQNISNPYLAYQGTIDLSFVTIYLLPLLVIFLCHDLSKSDTNSSLELLIRLQTSGSNGITYIRLFIYWLSTFMISTMIVYLNYLFSDIHPIPYHDAFLWIYVSCCFLTLWIAISHCTTLLFKKTSAISISLLTCYILLLFIIPTLVSNYMDLAFPEKAATTLEDRDRHLSEDTWQSKPAKLVKQFYRDHPQYYGASAASDTLDSQNEVFFAAYQYVKEAKMSHYQNEEETASQRFDQTFAKIEQFSPAQLVSALFNRIAGTSYADYKAFKAASDELRNQWNKNLLDRTFYLNNGKRTTLSFTKEELKNLPELKFFAAPASFKNLLIRSMPLWCFILIFTGLNIFLTRLITYRNK